MREHTRTYYLGRLSDALEVWGLDVRLRPELPALRVSDPETALLSETVDCVPLQGGWFYRWSWGETLGRADDPVSAAQRIATVFRPC
ncbi:hypothetical protein [Nonomuraea typhae]|uniref:Uncharacterized protein n=1 Tax=Nonomuraea typhae TaxID=2603600 RepID=A0ABW7Z5D1_9ACTN|nr:hypothetical protein [Nonomuraea typhae]